MEIVLTRSLRVFRAPMDIPRLIRWLLPSLCAGFPRAFFLYSFFVRDVLLETLVIGYLLFFVSCTLILGLGIRRKLFFELVVGRSAYPKQNVDNNFIRVPKTKG